ncbi:DUF2911 domain-containing protein [Sediminibacterium soli]|uniref:DUF2911 domain-containing protein n=1 Tax=Sediminibacterium soli TaxID=2698829 RepID=UPI0013795FBD|nr:DUF2911 domain-containing protein [Sediminibacterium soli]NCI45654.1 DUF2911 domain-containing protein [Sediminibacterium soli]
MKNAFLLVLAAICLSTTAMAQPASPAATATGRIGEANVTVKYSSPRVKGRQVWGALVPYDKVWRAGANAATVIETDKDLTVEGKKLPAGKYSVYAIPGQNEWTIIFNSQTGQWGITRQGETTLDPSKDVLRVNVKPVKSATLQEELKYDVNASNISLSWENLVVPISVK